MEKIIDSVKDCLIGDPVRLVHDKTIAPETLAVVMRKLGVASTDSLIPGGRYHHRRDYMNFPSLNRKDLLYSAFPALPLKEVSLEENILEAVAKRSYDLHAYQNFAYVIKFLREAALDPQVKTIKITIYRLAKLSQVASSLINAAKNGKKYWFKSSCKLVSMKRIISKLPKVLKRRGSINFCTSSLKVHTKICVIERLEGKKLKRYGFISTGNFEWNHQTVFTQIIPFLLIIKRF